MLGCRRATRQHQKKTSNQQPANTRRIGHQPQRHLQRRKQSAQQRSNARVRYSSTGHTYGPAPCPYPGWFQAPRPLKATSHNSAYHHHLSITTSPPSYQSRYPMQLWSSAGRSEALIAVRRRSWERGVGAGGSAIRRNVYPPLAARSLLRGIVASIAPVLTHRGTSPVQNMVRTRA